MKTTYRRAYRIPRKIDPDAPDKVLRDWGHDTSDPEWEAIACCTHRLRVPGGWLVQNGDEDGESMAFVSDPAHEWGLETIDMEPTRDEGI